MVEETEVEEFLFSIFSILSLCMERNFFRIKIDSTFNRNFRAFSWNDGREDREEETKKFSRSYKILQRINDVEMENQILCHPAKRFGVCHQEHDKKDLATQQPRKCARIFFHKEREANEIKKKKSSPLKVSFFSVFDGLNVKWNKPAGEILPCNKKTQAI